MKRNIENLIKDWLVNSNKALLLEGARQVGKTYIIRQVLNDNNINFYEINFLERPDILEIFKKIENTEELIEKLIIYSNGKLAKEDDVVFFDEIQCCPEIVTKIKFLVDKHKFKYILSGSLLGDELKNIKSVPVGYMQTLRLYPMSFYEFCIAMDVKDETINYLNDCFNNHRQVDDVIHKKILSLFRLYLIVGGMPDAVKSFVKNKDLVTVDTIQKNILSLYKADFSKYESNDRKLRIVSIFDNIPSQLNKQNQRFIFTYLNSELKFDRYENSFLWLKEAGVSYPVYICNQLKPPLVISKEKNTFKLFMCDVGLLTSCYPYYVKEAIINDDLKINNGALYENYAAQTLFGNNINPYYYKSTKIGEIDFVIELNNKIVPIEIKSGSDYKNHKSLNKLKENNNMAYVFSDNNIEITNNIYYCPIYMLEFLKETQISNLNINIDVEGL